MKLQLTFCKKHKEKISCVTAVTLLAVFFRTSYIGLSLADIKRNNMFNSDADNVTVCTGSCAEGGGPKCRRLELNYNLTIIHII